MNPMYGDQILSKLRKEITLIGLLVQGARVKHLRFRSAEAYSQCSSNDSCGLSRQQSFIL